MEESRKSYYNNGKESYLPLYFYIFILRDTFLIYFPLPSNFRYIFALGQFSTCYHFYHLTWRLHVSYMNIFLLIN
uniref:Putative ovule protein n=1 Tax=Solanum chacoense TaxID=4108 RepID=A0A0V0H3T5_SOLCH